MPATPKSNLNTKHRSNADSTSTQKAKMKQVTLGSFFQPKSTPSSSTTGKSQPDTKSDPPANPASESTSIPPSVNDEDEDEEMPMLTTRKANKRKSVVMNNSPDSSEIDEPSTNKKSNIAKKPRYSRGSNASAASQSEEYSNTEVSSNLDDLDSDASFDGQESDTEVPVKRVSKAKSKTSNAKSSSSALWTTAEKKKQQEKSENESKQAPWKFLRDIRDADQNPIGSPEYDPRTLYISREDWKSMTPFETQFWEIKQRHFDTVLFFQKGKFSELYEGDAMIGHREFDLKITKRVKMSMVGVPETSVDFWIAKFLAKGYKVGKVDQCETALGAEMRNKGSLPSAKSAKSQPKAKPGAKEIVRRELRSVVTSGTIVDGSILTDDAATCLMAIKETIGESGLPIFGVVILDASTAEFNLSHFDDSANRTHLETIMSRFRPKEIVHEKAGLSTSTMRVLKNIASSDCTWTALKNDEFLEIDECLSRLSELFGEAKKKIPEAISSFHSKPETMMALGGLLWYLGQLNLDKELLSCDNVKVLDVFRPTETMQLDGKTISDLELLQGDLGEDSRLLKLLNRCITPFGKRLFRHWLCSPLQSASAIEMRLDSVTYLIEHPDFVDQFGTLTGLPDLERLISRIHAGSCTVKNFLKVLKSFQKIQTTLETLKTAIGNDQPKILDQLLGKVPDVAQLIVDIEEMFTLDEEKKDLLPLEGKDELYDAAIEEEREAEGSLDDELEAAKKLLKSKDVVYKHIGIKDIYQIQVPAKIKAPSNWTKMSGTKDCARYYSPQSAQLVKKLKQAREKKTSALKDFHLRVFALFDQSYPDWLLTVKTVAEIDCLVSLAQASIAIGEPSCRPEIMDLPQAEIRFETLRHPCAVGRDESDFIANDVMVGGDECRMILLTGPNMAGKSTLLRMTCVAVIMAQLGCHVPAQSARISPVDRICTRMGASDHIFAHASTFKVEMDDAKKILSEATPKSLMILDELGRGTSTFDGHAIAFAVLHRLATHCSCLGFFATHYSALNEDFAHHPNIAPKYMLTNVDEETREVLFLYKLTTGVSPKSYGPHVAKMGGIPNEIVKRAISISEEFEVKSKSKQIEQKKINKLSLTLQADVSYLIRILKNSSLNDDEKKKESLGERLQVLNRIKLGFQKERGI